MNDKFYTRAKEQGFRARSVFKLKDIIQKYNFVKRGDRVLDLGASPGSWMQYLSKFCSYVLGVDVSNVQPVPGAIFLQKSVLDEDIIDIIKQYKPQFDVVVSDMAPKTCGKIEIDQVRSYELCQRAFVIASEVLKPNGNFMCKIFQSADSNDLLRELREYFNLVKIVKPLASKKESKEIYFVCIGLKA